jgi:hypothetical protein
MSGDEHVFHYLKIKDFNHNVLVGREIYKRRKTETEIFYFGTFVNTKSLRDGSDSIIVQAYIKLTGGMKNFDFFIKIPFISDPKAPVPNGALTLDEIDNFADEPGSIINIVNKLSKLEIKGLEVFELKNGMVYTTTGLAIDPFCWWIVLA